MVQHLAVNDLRRRLEQARDGVAERRFTAAAFTGQPQDLPTFQRQADIGQRVHRAVFSTVVNADVLDLQQGPARSRKCSIAHGASTFFVLRDRSARIVRRRGLAISSVPEVAKANPAPRIAINSAGGTNHTQYPSTDE